MIRYHHLLCQGKIGNNNIAAITKELGYISVDTVNLIEMGLEHHVTITGELSALPAETIKPTEPSAPAETTKPADMTESTLLPHRLQHLSQLTHPNRIRRQSPTKIPGARS